jgi:hypothetical protein
MQAYIPPQTTKTTPTPTKRDQFSLNFVTISNKKLPDIVMKPVTGVVLLKVVFTLLRNSFMYYYQSMAER